MSFNNLASIENGPPLIDLREAELVRLVMLRLRRTYDAFGFVFDDLPERSSSWNYVFLAEVPRAMLGLDPRLQPGDVDVLIVPEIAGRLATEYSAAIEVKRVSLREGVLGKNVGRYGITQASGLWRDGFPLVGILHIVVTEPGPIEHHRDLQIWRVVDDQGRAEYQEDVRADITGSLAADRQIARLRSQIFEERIGFNSIGIQRVDEIRLYRVYPSYGRRSKLNFSQSPKLLLAIERMVEQHRPHFVERD